jgi:acetyltransferase-like isoleucine patch superfamily enzyme
VTLEDDVLLGSHVSITNGAAQHGIDRLDIPIREQPGTWPRVTIGQDTWIGDRAVIMADVGKHCVIGAGSVVTTPIPDCTIAVGVPARVVRSRVSPDQLAPASRAASVDLTCGFPVSSS